MKIRHLAATMVAFALILASTTFIFKKIRSPKSIHPEIIKHFNLDSINAKTITTKKDLITWLNEAEKALWLEIKSTSKLTQYEYERHANDCKKDYAESIKGMKEKYCSGQSLSQETVEYIKSIMIEFNVSPDTVELVAWNIDIPGSATDTVIFVNEKVFNNLDPQTKKFIIGHELIHLINKDHSTRYVVRNIPAIVALDANDSNNPINKLCHFHELRADILANLHGLDYAEGAIHFMQAQIQKFGDCRMHAYPKYSTREKIGTKISRLVTTPQKSSIV